jgi:glyoxylase-like metal-dependent hydrolase (beta-lactamase superfamily II)
MTTIHRINEQILLTEVEHPDYLVRGAVLQGRKATLIWDTLTHPDDMQALLPVIGDRPPIVVYSHADWDHIWGTAALAPAPHSVIGHRLCRRRFADDVPATLRQRTLEEPGRWDAVHLVPPNRLLDDTLILDLGGMTLELHALPGHTPDSVVGLVVEHGLLLMGDTVETPLPCVPVECPLGDWLGELRRWLADSRVLSVVPAHGPWGGKEIIGRTVSYLHDLQTRHARWEIPGLSPFYRQTHEDNMSNRQGVDQPVAPR